MPKKPLKKSQVHTDHRKPDRDFPVKAYKNFEFMDSPQARPIRILSEFIEPQTRMHKYKIRDTIVYFGSARTKSQREARAALRELKKNPKRSKKAQAEALEQAEMAVKMSRYYEDCRELSSKMTTWSKKLKGSKYHFISCSGGGPGIMTAANQGASEANGLSIGFNISIPFEQSSNPYITPELNFEFHYFFMRKYWFAYMAKALVVFPGGFGTLDELAEVLTLIQTHKITKPIPIVIYGTEYWRSVLNLKEMVRWGTISQKDLDLFHFSDTPEDAFKFLTKELKKHYLK